MMPPRGHWDRFVYQRIGEGAYAVLSRANPSRYLGVVRRRGPQVWIVDRDGTTHWSRNEAGSHLAELNAETMSRLQAGLRAVSST